MESEYNGWSMSGETGLALKLKGVISHLRNDQDIDGVALIGKSDIIIASDLPSEKNYITDIPDMLTRFRRWYDSTLKLNGMFAHCIMDYNGFKVLIKRLKDDLTLLVIMEKQGYVGLAMIEIENSIREIRGILKGGVCSKSAN